MGRRCVVLCALLCPWVALGAAPSVPPASALSRVVEIKPSDKPMAMPAVRALLADVAADRRTCGLPPGMSEIDYLKTVLEGKMERLKGYWPFRPPSGDPATFGKAQYLEAIKSVPAVLPYYEQRYGKGTDPIKADANAWEMVPVYTAFWKATHEQKYLDMVVRGVKAVCLATDEELAANPTKPVSYNRYWKDSNAYIYLSLLELTDTPEFPRLTAMLGKSLANLANAWPVAPFDGAFNMSFMSAFWYDLALKYHPNLSRAKELRAYAERIWRLWWDVKDINEECGHYTMLDLLLLDAWCRLRGVGWWTDPERMPLFRQYAEQVSNDGTWPAYGDGGAPGDYFQPIWLCERMATLTRDGRYKWFAHRALWNGRDRLFRLCAGSGYLNQSLLGLAYCMADDTVKEVPPSAGVLLTQRHWMDITPVETRLRGGNWFDVQPKLAPRKLVFRAGPRETDAFMLVEAGQLGGHGHTDSGAIHFWGSDHAYYFDYATLRLDNYMEAHNSFALRDPKLDKPWPGRPDGLYTTEDVSVPAMGRTSVASYARVHVQEHPGARVTEESWNTVQNWRKTWTLEKAIGYRNWPMRLDRSFLFVNNTFTVVRDVADFQLPAAAQMGPNWTFGELGSAGTNWVNVWVPKVLFAYGTRLRPVETAPRDLLIWSAPKPDGTLVIEKLLRERTGIDCYTPANSLMNLPMRAWYTRTRTWQPGKPQAFTTVLMPHKPTVDAAALAATISIVKDTADSTALKVADGDTVTLIVLAAPGKTVTVDRLALEAEAVMLITVKGEPRHLSAWQARRVTLDGKVLFQSNTPAVADKRL